MKKIKNVVTKSFIAFTAVAGCFSLAACGGGTGDSAGTTQEATTTASASSTGRNLVINTYGTDEVFDSVPERIFSVNYECAQMLLGLGLDDKIVGTTSAHFALDELLPEYRSKIEALNTVGQSTAFEEILNNKPDFIFGHGWIFNEGGVAPQQDCIDNNIKYYAVTGTSGGKSTFEGVYDDLKNLGKIFEVEDKADEIIGGMKERLEKVKENAVKDEPTIFVYDSGEKQAYTAGDLALQTEQIELVGAKNLFKDLNETYVEVSWEEVAKRNPDWILINEYEDENLTTTKTEFLKNNDALKDTNAIKNNHIISINLIELREGLQMVDGSEKLLKALNGEAY